MRQRVLAIDGSRIRDWQTFHDVFSEALGFPIHYGRNMNAWVDCMTYLDADDGLSQVVLADDEELMLRIDGAEDLRNRCPNQYQALLDSVAFVNERRVGLRSILNLDLKC